ncbi:uncharacterized protein LOC119464243 isoform X4 [Dermacentor silvarum]|uniref:uncharacterized protein LOC119464243 isoform X4 n=1 Tax=Dermacentor silvarum TaxID=543639 RepID=UPI002101C51D|nr:uncharacterized protein LOC119464243 isoform X4 [Dermacentor silvarum]
MRKDVQYRDLPGGPLMVKFADELPLCSLCSKCGMLSKDMFEDPSSHAFCSICIFECSDRKKIHCKFENKDVSVEEMMPAIDIINIIMDQVVFCPNASDGNSCTKYCTLKDLEGHFLECEKTEIICLSCGDTVKGRDWPAHVTTCPQQIMQCRYCIVAVPRCRLELHERQCSSNPNAVREAESCPTATMDFTARLRSDWPQNERQLPVTAIPNKQHVVPEAKPTALSKIDDVVMLSCPKCKRNVKSKNMDKHISVCQQRIDHPCSLEARQTPEIAHVLPTRNAGAIRAPVHENPPLQRQEGVLPDAPISHTAQEGHPHQYALTSGDVVTSAPVHPDPNLERQKFAPPDSSIAHFAPSRRLHDEYALPTRDDVAMRAPIQPDFHLQRQQSALPASSTSNFAEERRHDGEAPAVGSDADRLLSAFEVVNVSDVPRDCHGPNLGVRQGGGCSQMTTGDIVATQPSWSQESPGEHPPIGSRESNTRSHSLQPLSGKWPQHLQQGDWGRTKARSGSGNAPSVRKTTHRSCNSNDKSQLTLRWSKHQCYETIEYYADVSCYYDEPEGADGDNDYDAIDINQFPRRSKRAGHDGSSGAVAFIRTNTTL